MPEPILLPLAEADLDAIWLYIAQENLSAADCVIDEIWERCRLLAVFPGMGQARSDLAAGLRASPVETYVIFYRPVDEDIEIVRILHGMRNIHEEFF